MDDKADQLDGWPIQYIEQTASPAVNDLYGKLAPYLRRTISKMLERLTAVKVHFQVYNMDARDLPGHLKEHSYARIEVCT